MNDTATASNESAFVTFTRAMNSMGAIHNASYNSMAAAKPKSLDADMLTAATAAGMTEKDAAKIKHDLAALRQVTAQAMKDAGLTGKGVPSDKQIQEMNARVKNTEEYKAVANDLTKQRSQGKRFAAKSALAGGGVAGLATGAVGVVVGGIVKLGAALIGKSDKVSFKGITKTFALAGLAVGGIVGAVLASPISLYKAVVNPFRNKAAKNRENALDGMINIEIRNQGRGKVVEMARTQTAPAASTPGQAKTTAAEAVAATAAAAGGAAVAASTTQKETTPTANTTTPSSLPSGVASIADARARRDARNVEAAASAVSVPNKAADDFNPFAGAAGADFREAKPAQNIVAEVKTPDERAREAAAALRGASGASFGAVSGGEPAKLDQNTVANVKPAEKTETTARA